VTSEDCRDLPLAGERLPLAVRGLAVALGFNAAEDASA
jgi:hypothetical protein